MNYLNIIIKLTHKCNLNCIYCYDKKNKNNNIMSNTTVSNIIVWVKKYCEKMNIYNVNFIWHGGEPLLAFELIKYAITIQKNMFDNSSINFTNGIQTNGTLLNDSMIRFIKENNIMIGISLDGDKNVNDKGRFFYNGKGTYEIIKNNMNKLDRNNIIYGISTVVSEYNHNNLMDIYNYFKKSKMDFDLIIDFNINDELIEDISESIISLFNYWYFDEGVSIKLFENLLKSIILKKPYLCQFDRNCCDGIDKLIIDIDEKTYPCSSFVGNEKYSFGNIIDINSYDDIIKSIGYKNIRAHKERLTLCCKSCKYSNICGLGCLYTQINITNNYYCKLHKKLIKNALDKLKVDDMLLNELEQEVMI